MPTFRHGKTTRVYFNQYDLSQYLNSVDIAQKIDTGETTTFGASAKTYIPGLRDGTIKADGLFEAVSTDAVDVVLNTSVNGTGDDVLTIAPEGPTALRRCLLAMADATSYDVKAAVGDVVSVSAEYQVDGGVDGGYLYAAAQAVTTAATTNGTALDFGSATTNGGVAHLHVTANTWSGATTVKVQSSSDNVTFTDLVTFTNVTASTLASQRVVVASGTTVNRYVRAQATTAAGTGSITYTVAFARR